MNAILQYVRRLILVIFMVQVGRMLSPDGDLKPYVHFVCGLLVIMAVIQPLAGLVPELRGAQMGARLSEMQVVGQGDDPPVEAFEGRGKTETLAEEIYLQRVSDLLSAEIEQLTAVRQRGLAVRVSARLLEDEGEQTAQIVDVTVHLSEEPPVVPVKSEQSGVVVSVESIPTVSVSDEAISEGEYSADTVSADGVPGEVREAILQHLRDTYRIDAQQVRIKRED